MSNVSSTRKKKVSVNPAKNTQHQRTLSEEKKSDDPTLSKTSSTEKINDLDKNRLKNWKLRRELKKALNSDLSPKKNAENETAAEELPKKQKGKNIKKHSSQKDEEKVAQENIVVDDSADDAENDDNIDNDREVEIETLKNDPEQEYASDRMELLKFKAHRGLRKLAYKLLMINFIKNVLIPKLRSVLIFWWRQLKNQGVGRIAFITVSLVIIFALIVPPMWGAIESYRSGIWRMFG